MFFVWYKHVTLKLIVVDAATNGNTLLQFIPLKGEEGAQFASLAYTLDDYSV